MLSVKCWVGRRKVELYLISACGALDILLKPSSETVKMKNVTTLQLLRLSDLLETDDTSVVHACWEISWSVYIWKPL